VRTLTRPELTASLAARQLLLDRERLAPAEAIRRLTPLQGQASPAPYVALAARLDGFAREELERAVSEREVVRTTVMRNTLHLVHADEYPAYAQLARQTRMRAWRKAYSHLDEDEVVAELGAWLREPRSNAEIRERVGRYSGVPDDEWSAIFFARMVLPLVQLPPAGHWRNRSRLSFVLDPRPLPDPADAAALVVARDLAAFGPASRRDVAAWAGVAQRDFAGALERVPTVAYRDEAGTELLDLPDQPLPPASTRLPVRFLARWDQALLAYADRERIIPAELHPLAATVSGEPTFTVDGRVAGTWNVRDGELTVTPEVELSRAQRAAVKEEAARTARLFDPRSQLVTGL
jgi:hypothetical protein